MGLWLCIYGLEGKSRRGGYPAGVSLDLLLKLLWILPLGFAFGEPRGVAQSG